MWGSRAQFAIALKTLAERGDEAATKLNEYYSSLTPNQQRRVTFDELVLKAEIDVIDFIKEMAGVMYELGVGFGNVLAAAHHPNVVAAGITQALEPAGVKDRQMLFQHHRFLPTAKGATVNVGVSVQNTTTPASDAGDDGRLPSFEEETIAMRSVARRELPPAGEESL